MNKYNNQTGQVLVLGLIVVALISLAFIRYFLVNKTIEIKTRLVHGLDAAAYSGALVQARSLNLLAYLNRAQLAHQVAQAHLISLGSWANYGATQANRLSMANPPAHLIGMLFGADYGVAYLSAAKASSLGLGAAGDGLVNAFASHESFIHNDIKSLSNTLVANLPDLRLKVIHEVLAANLPEFDFTEEVVADEWPNILGLQLPNKPLLDLLKQISGLYKFLQPRNFTQQNNWVVDSRCPSLRHELRRRGATELDNSGRWQSSDTQSFHALRSNRWIGCYYREYVMGWAWLPPQQGASVNDIYVEDPPDDFSQQDFWRWVNQVSKWSYLDNAANPLANSYAMRDAKKWPNRGLLPYYDVVGKVNDKFFASSSFRVKAKLILGDDSPTIYASSAAQTSFLRPTARQDKKQEAANLFNPFWQASLAKGLVHGD